MSFDARTAKAALLEALGRREAELVGLCSELIQIPSENPPGDTTAIAGFVVEYLGRIGLTARTFAPKADRPSVLATVHDGGDGPSLMLNSHLDEFPATGDGWEYPPFSGRVAAGRIHGRGASDMRAGLAVSLLLARLVRELELPLPGRLLASFSADEEAAGTWGTRWLLDNVPEFRADACLIGDQCGVWAVGVGEKGGCWLRLRTAGRSSHAAYGTARSATAPLVRALARVLELESLVVPPPAALVHYLEAEREQLGDAWGTQAPAILDRVTANVGRLSGGTSINLVADSAEAEVDLRLPIGLSTADLLRLLRERLGAGPESVELEVIAAFEPTWTSPDGPLARAVRENALTVRGEAAQPVVRLGATDARWFRAAGIPTMVYGPAAYNMGGANESITVDDLLTVARVHAGAIVDYFAAGEPG